MKGDGRSAGLRAVALAATLSTTVAFAAVVLSHGATAVRDELPLDDAWIHLDYARGLLRDGAPTYNPGRPEAGFSSPLWVLVGALVLLASRVTAASPALCLKLASALLGLAAAVVIARASIRRGASTAVALVAAAAAPLGPWWCASAASGMEVTATTLLLALALAQLDDDRPARAGGLLALSVLARPECAAGVAALVALPSMRGRRAAAALPTGLAVAAWVAYDLAVTGHPWPTTAYVKAGGAGLGRSLRFLAATLTEDGVVVGASLLALAVAGLRRGSRDEAARWAALALAPLAGVLASRALNPAVLLYQRRYLYPFLLVLWWPAALGMESLVALVASRAPARARAFGVALGALALAATIPSVLAARALHAAWCHDIATLHTAPARALAELAPPDAVVAVEGAGAARFFGGREVVDLVGLNEHALAHRPRGSRAHLCHLLRVRRPTWFVLPSTWVARFAPAWDFVPAARFVRDAYAQVDPPVRRAVLLLRATPRPEALALCGPVSAAPGAAPAPPSAP